MGRDAREVPGPLRRERREREEREEPMAGVVEPGSPATVHFAATTTSGRAGGCEARFLPSFAARSLKSV